MARCGGDAASGGTREGRGRGGDKGVLERRRLKEMVARQLSQDVNRLLKEEIQTDIIFCVGNTLFKAHKALLSVRVPNFFSHIAGGAFNNANTCKVIHLENVEPSEFKRFLQ
uniref:Uncharacterized protein n=3 Tax=Sphaerodactylus townsendi TaxID=933632 RepID=A0ACB8F3L2_9SAUR